MKLKSVVWGVFLYPLGRHLHPSRASYYGQHPSRSAWRWRHRDLLHLQPLGLWGALHSSGVRQPTQLRLHVPLRSNSPRSGQAGRSGVKDQSGAPPGVRRGAICDTWKWAAVPHGCHGKESGAHHWACQYHRWAVLHKEKETYWIWCCCIVLIYDIKHCVCSSSFILLFGINPCLKISLSLPKAPRVKLPVLWITGCACFILQSPQTLC